MTLVQLFACISIPFLVVIPLCVYAYRRHSAYIEEMNENERNKTENIRKKIIEINEKRMVEEEKLFRVVEMNYIKKTLAFLLSNSDSSAGSKDYQAYVKRYNMFNSRFRKERMTNLRPKMKSEEFNCDHCSRLVYNNCHVCSKKCLELNEKNQDELRKKYSDGNECFQRCMICDEYIGTFGDYCQDCLKINMYELAKSL